MEGGDGRASPRPESVASARSAAENDNFTMHAYDPGSGRVEDGCDFDALDLDVEDGYLGAEGLRPVSVASDVYPDETIARYQHDEQREREVVDGLRTPRNKTQRGVRSLWLNLPKSAENGSSSSIVVRETLSGLAIHSVFLAILCGIVFGMSSSSAYYFNSLVQAALVDGKFRDGSGSFQAMSTVGDFWKFAGPDGVLLRELYATNGSAYQGSRKPSLLLQQSTLLGGAVQLRQLRVRNDSCDVYADFAGDGLPCYAVYSRASEERRSFGDGIEWSYRTSEELGWQSTYIGRSASYESGGYVASINTSTMQQSADVLRQLIAFGWIDNATRAVLIEFTLHNSNINLFCFVRLVTEFPPTGGALPSSEIRTVKLLRYVSTGDYVILACEVLFVMFIPYLVADAVMRIKRVGWKHYLHNPWNWFDWILIFMSATCVGLNSYRTYAVNTYLEIAMVPAVATTATYDFLSYWQTQFDYVIAVELFFAWVKVFRFVKLNRSLAQMATTLDQCRSDLVAFSAMFIVIFLAFAQLAYLIFGSQVQGFSSFTETCISLVRMILGDVSIHQLEAANRIMGPIFFVVYTFFVFFVLLNMFLAIVCEAYVDARVHVGNSKHEYDVTSYLKQQYSKMADKLSSKKAVLKANAAHGGRTTASRSANAGQAEGFDRVEEEDLGLPMEQGKGRENRPRREMRGLACQPTSGSSSYTSRGDSDDCDCYDDEVSSSSAALPSGRTGDGTAQHRLPAARGSGGVSNLLAQEEFTVLTRRVDRMEHSIGSIVSKIDAVLVKLEAIEKAKVRRKETMGKLLDSIKESSGGRSEELKRDQMEQLVRQELERMTEGMEVLYEP